MHCPPFLLLLFLSPIKLASFADHSMFQEVVGHRKNMQLADYVLTIALGGAFALGLLFIVMRREANVNIQSGMNAEG